MALSLEAQRVRKELVKTYGPGVDVERLAEVAAVSWDRAEVAGARVEAEGLTLPTPHGIIPHPCVGIERLARLSYLSAVRALRQQPKRDKIGRPSKADQITRRFFGDDTPRRRPSPGFAEKYLRPPS